MAPSPETKRNSRMPAAGRKAQTSVCITGSIIDTINDRAGDSVAAKYLVKYVARRIANLNIGELQRHESREY